jgi:hypothetical protein
MALPYVKPGVTVSEIVSPQLTPALLDPNVIAIVGPGRGYEEHVETFVLIDNTPVTLSANNPDPSTIVVRDASDVTLAPFQETIFNASPGNNILADYEVDTSDLLTNGTVDILRSMQTNIANGEEVVIYYETSATPTQADGETVLVTLNLLTPVTMTQGSVGGLVPSTLTVTRKGNLVAGGVDVTIAGAGGPTPTITYVNTSTRISKFQTIYVDFVIDTTQYKDQPVQLNNTTPVSLPANANNISAKNAPGTYTSNAFRYTLSTTEEADYTVTGSGATTAVRRSRGSTTIGGLNDKLTVRVSYRATPKDYYAPTRCFSQNDVETKFGPPFDSLGNVINPISLATLFAFQNGATQIVAQALFSNSLDNRQAPTGALNDWELSFQSLRTVQDISIITPIIAAGNLSTTVTDSLNLSILQACQTHLRYMAAQENQFIIAICGEDSTNGTLASTATLRSHGDALGSGNPSEAVVLITPSAFTFTNPVTGLAQDIGGQYVAAAIAGMCARYPVQMPLTRKRINVLTALKVTRTETQKDEDAQSGLCVVENKRGRIQVRHSITTNQDTRAQQELSVVRAKYWMMKNLVDVLDTQAVGTLILDTEANFSIQVLIASQLELLVQQGAIVSYDNIQVRRDPNDATALQVRFSYLPAYPLNHINISFSINAQQGVVFDQATTTQGF